jgi:hypothetical protein
VLVTELLSVVVPTHDRPDRVGAAVRSVLDQDVPALEVVVVDDGSGPATTEVLDRLADGDARVVVVRHDEPRGASAARNTGLDAARGELIGFCDDDDTWLPDTGARAVAACVPGTGIVYGYHQVLIEDTGRLVTFRPPDRPTPELLRWIDVTPSIFGVVRRVAVGDALRFDTTLPTSEDWDLRLRCAEVAPMALVPVPLYRYVQHAGVRLSATPTAHAAGHHAFVQKHRTSMTAACVAHHELAYALARRDRDAARHQLTALPHHPANLGSALLLAGEMVASRVGRRRDDPGLTLRFAARALRHATRGDVG